MDKEDIEYVKNVLRRGTITWRGTKECLNRGRYKKTCPETGRVVYFRDCDKCKAPFKLADKLLEVDHIEEIGSFDGSFDTYVRKMYCGQENLQALCVSCHAKKTLAFNNARLTFTRKK